MSSTPVSEVPPTPHLAENAAYGKLPFDGFALKHWDYSRPVEEDQNQWDELARRWLLMDHKSRSPYWEAAYGLAKVPADNPQMPIQEQINRVLVPHQTFWERNLALLINDCLWVRTCYEASLVPAFAEMTQVVRTDNAHCVLDNESLYGNLGSDLSRLFLRMPQLPDTVAYCGVPETEDLPLQVLEEPPEDDSMVPLYNAMIKERLVIYLLDREALEKRMLKVTWFDLSGNQVWWNWMSPLEIQAFEGHLNGLGHRLNYIFELSDGDPSLLREGAVIQLD